MKTASINKAISVSVVLQILRLFSFFGLRDVAVISIHFFHILFPGKSWSHCSVVSKFN